MMKYIMSILLVLTMIVIPYSINGIASLYIYAIALLSILGIFLKWTGAEFMLIAISLCLPAGWDGTSGLVFREVDKMHFAFMKFTHYIIPITGYYLLYNNKFEKKKTILNLTLGILFVGIMQTVFTLEVDELNLILNIIGYSYAFLLICYFDKKIKITDIFLYVDVLFAVSLVYGIFEYFFRESPYQYITDAATNITAIGRARGILGHPLYLSGLALIYQSVIFIRYLLLKKFVFFQEVMCVAMALIVVSRTTIVVMILEYMLFVIMTKGYKSAKFWIYNGIAIVIGGFFISIFANSIILDIAIRFVEGNTEHREGAFSTVFLLFFDNPFGVGFFNIMEKIWKGGYGAIGFGSDFSTVDNLFLSQLAAYGIFSVFKIAFYFYFLIDSYKSRNRNPMLFKVVLFLYFPFLFEAFSFDWDTSAFLCFLLYGLIGFMYRYCCSNQNIKVIAKAIPKKTKNEQ